MTLKKLTSTAVLTTLATVAWALPALAQQGRGGFSCPWGTGDMMWGGGWFGMIFMWLFWALVVVALVGGIRLIFRSSQSGGGQSGPAGKTEDPLTVLKTRYAKGEITKEEFDRIKADLT